jgi:hypothetical protein
MAGAGRAQSTSPRGYHNYSRPAPTAQHRELSPRRGRQSNIDSPTHAEADSPTETTQHREPTPRPTTQHPELTPTTRGSLTLARSEGWADGYGVGAQAADRWQLGWIAGYEYGWNLGWVEGRRLMAQALALPEALRLQPTTSLQPTTPEALALQPTTPEALAYNPQPDEEPPHDDVWSRYRSNEWAVTWQNDNDTYAEANNPTATALPTPRPTTQHRQPNTESPSNAETDNTTCTATWRHTGWTCFDARCTYCRFSSHRVRRWQ